MRIAVLADVHAHADALEAVGAAAVAARVDALWSLGDMVGGGPDAVRVVRWVRTYCAVALVGNHDFGATGSIDPARFGPPGSLARRSLELAARQLAGTDELGWMRSRRPAARRPGVQCWHASPRDPVREYVGPQNVADCMSLQRSPLGLVGHTHAPDAWQARPGEAPRRAGVQPGRPLDVGDGKWLLNPGAVGAPFPARPGWWEAMDAHARDGAWWLELDLGDRVATWHRAPFDPVPARERAHALGLVGSDPHHPAG